MPTRDRLLKRYGVKDKALTNWCRSCGISESEIPRGYRIASDKVFNQLEELWIATRVCHLPLKDCCEKFAKGYSLKKIIKERHPNRTLLEHLKFALLIADPKILEHPVVLHKLEQLEINEPTSESEPETRASEDSSSSQPPTYSGTEDATYSRRFSNIY